MRTKLSCNFQYNAHVRMNSLLIQEPLNGFYSSDRNNKLNSTRKVSLSLLPKFKHFPAFWLTADYYAK